MTTSPRPEPPAVELRRWGSGATDAEALAAAWSDPAIAWFTEPPEAALVETRRLDVAADWLRGEPARHTSGLVADRVIARAADPDEVLGEVGLVLRDAERGLAEVGYWLLPAARGLGLATAAVSLLVDLAHAGGAELHPFPAVRTVMARTLPGNAASEAVLARSGFGRAGRLADGRELWRSDAP